MNPNFKLLVIYLIINWNFLIATSAPTRKPTLVPTKTKVPTRKPTISPISGIVTGRFVNATIQNDIDTCDTINSCSLRGAWNHCQKTLVEDLISNQCNLPITCTIYLQNFGIGSNCNQNAYLFNSPALNISRFNGFNIMENPNCRATISIIGPANKGLICPIGNNLGPPIQNNIIGKYDDRFINLDQILTTSFIFELKLSNIVFKSYKTEEKFNFPYLDLETGNIRYFEDYFSNTINGGIMLINTPNVIGTFENIEFGNRLIKSAGEVGGMIYIGKSGPIIFENCQFLYSYSSDSIVVQVFSDDVDDYIPKFDQMNTPGTGGAIYLEGSSNIRMNNCLFDANNAVFLFGNGGAIYFNHTTNISITNTIFESNLAGGDGGALYLLKSSNIHIIGCQFRGNKAAYLNPLDVVSEGYFIYGGNLGGGAIAITKSSDIIIENCQFIRNNLLGNKKEIGGGAMTIFSSKNIIIHNCIFSKNTIMTNERGGALFILQSQEINISNTLFENNINNGLTSNGENLTPYGGGAVSISKSKFVTIMNSNFLYNRNTNTDGGALLIYKSSNTIIRKSLFSGNLNFRYGGHVMINKLSGSLLLEESQFYNGYSVIGGGGLAMISTTINTDIVILNCQIFNNTCIEKGGGGIYLNQVQGKIYFVGTNFTNNTLPDFTKTEDTVVYLNKGGGAYIENSTAIMEFEDCHWNGNFGNFGGGAMYFEDSCDGSLISMNRNSFMYNMVANTSNDTVLGSNANGGAILYVCNNNTVPTGRDRSIAKTENLFSITNSYFKSNTAFQGGAIYLQSITSNLMIRNTSFVRNYVTYSGGAIDKELSIGYTFIQNSTFIENIANYQGGAIALGGSIHTYFDQCKFMNNYASRAGALFGSNIKDLILSNSLFLKNKCRVVGAGVYLYSASDIKVSGCEFLKNINDDNMTTVHNGGGIYMSLCEKTMIENTKFHDNYAWKGGAIYYESSNSFTSIETSIFFNNIVKYDGGAIWMGTNHTHFNVFNSTFDSNQALEGSGGAIYILETASYLSFGGFQPFTGGCKGCPAVGIRNQQRLYQSPQYGSSTVRGYYVIFDELTRLQCTIGFQIGDYVKVGGYIRGKGDGKYCDPTLDNPTGVLPGEEGSTPYYHSSSFLTYEVSYETTDGYAQFYIFPEGDGMTKTTLFQNNMAKLQGGAIYMGRNLKYVMFPEGVSFVENHGNVLISVSITSPSPYKVNLLRFYFFFLSSLISILYASMYGYP